MIASKSALTNVVFSPITSPSAVTRSGSMPMIVFPSGARNSFGAYCASVATVSVPFDLIAAGTVAAIDAFTAVALLDVVLAAVLDEDEELLLLPHPASTTTTSAAAPSAARSFL